MNTWVVEQHFKDSSFVLEYCKTLSAAKIEYEKNESSLICTFSILKITGKAFGEGYHVYRMYKINKKWTKETL